ncbi:DUF4296 domain-containing protein [Nemorincola caseinilytica]
MLNRVMAFLLLCGIAGMASCTYFDKSKDNHLPREKMRSILLDLSIAESYSAIVKDTTRKPGVKSPDSLAAYYKIIFDKHHMTKGTFDSSLAWYKQHPTEFDSLLTSIIPTATRWRDSAAKK